MTVTTVSNLDDRGPFSSPSKSLLYLDRFPTLSLDSSDAIVYGRNSDTSLRLGLEKELRLRRSRRVIIIDDERETVSCALLTNVSPTVTGFPESS